MDLVITDLEAAINWWRERRPAGGEECVLSDEVSVLARVYALMIYHRQHALALDSLNATARELIRQWRERPTQT
jgi:hypothetical protein